MPLAARDDHENRTFCHAGASSLPSHTPPAEVARFPCIPPGSPVLSIVVHTMLHANKSMFGATLRESLVANQMAEMQWFYNNFLCIAKRSVYLGGFALTGFASKTSQDLDIGVSLYGLETKAVMTTFYACAVTSFGIAMTCVFCNIQINIFGFGMALRGPDGSLALVLENYQSLQYKLIPAFIVMGTMYFPIAAIGMWLQMTHLVPVFICNGLLVFFFTALLTQIWRIQRIFALRRDSVESSAFDEQHIADIGRSNVIMTHQRAHRPAQMVQSSEVDSAIDNHRDNLASAISSAFDHMPEHQRSRATRGGGRATSTASSGGSGDEESAGFGRELADSIYSLVGHPSVPPPSHARDPRGSGSGGGARAFPGVGIIGRSGGDGGGDPYERAQMVRSLSRGLTLREAKRMYASRWAGLSTEERTRILTGEYIPPEHT